MGGIQVDPALQYERCLALNPRVGDSIRGAVRACARLPVRSVVCWGSIPLGGFIPHHSDIDLLFVSAGAPEGGPWPALLAELGSPSLDPIVVADSDLVLREPRGIRSLAPRRECVLHAMDLILIRRYSVVVEGEDLRGTIPDLKEADEIGGILRHVQDVLVSAELRKLSARGGETALVATDVLNVAHVMIRCLYTLRHGALASKPAALDWAIGAFGRRAECEPFVRLCRALRAELQDDGTARRELPGIFRQAEPVWTRLVGEGKDGREP